MPDGSPYFGSPTKLFEYLAMERPVVASRLGQIQEILADGESALLVEPGNAQALGAAIRRLAEDAPLRERLGRNARAMVTAKYTWRHNAARVFSALEPLLEAQDRAEVSAQAVSGGRLGA